MYPVFLISEANWIAIYVGSTLSQWARGSNMAKIKAARPLAGECEKTYRENLALIIKNIYVAVHRRYRTIYILR